MIRIFDSHTHLAFSDFDKDRREVVDRIENANLGIIEVGTTLESSRAAVKLAQENKNIWASVGIHPTESPVIFDGSEFLDLTNNERVVAVGECGLDYYHSSAGSEQAKVQKELFEKHIEFSKKVNLPLILHCRDAHDDVLEILNNHQGLTGTVHFFTGTVEQAEKYIDLGFYVGFDGPITFSSDYDTLIKEMPLEKILIETDSPYAAPAPHRGKRNEPTYVIEIAKKIANIKNISLDKVTEQTTENTKNLFNI